MSILRFIYWPPLAWARWLERESERRVRERGWHGADVGFYRVTFCILWTAVLVLVAVTAYLYA